MPSYAITGTSRGIGLEWVRQLSAIPSNTVLAIVRNPTTSTTLNELAETRPNIHVLTADVTDPASLQAAAANASAITYGSLDVFIHNAAHQDPASMGVTASQMPFEKDALSAFWQKIIDTSLYGAIWSTNAFLPLIKNGKEKKVIHTTSGLADLDFIKTIAAPLAVNYSAIKAAANVVTAAYAAEFLADGIKFLALSPGWVNSFDGPIPPEMIPVGEILLAQFRKAKPDLQGPISMEESVRSMRQVIEKLDDKLNGQFVSQHGNKDWL